MGRKRAMTATTITIPLIGRRKKMVQSFWKLIIVVMKEFSAIGPRIDPRTMGAMGNLILSKMYPTIPNATMSQRSDKLFRIERAPIKHRSMIKAETIDSGKSRIFTRGLMAKYPMTHMRMMPRNREAKTVYTMSAEVKKICGPG
jgi:hypothetical protein